MRERKRVGGGVMGLAGAPERWGMEQLVHAGLHYVGERRHPREVRRESQLPQLLRKGLPRLIVLPPAPHLLKDKNGVGSPIGMAQN